MQKHGRKGVCMCLGSPRAALSCRPGMRSSSEADAGAPPPAQALLTQQVLAFLTYMMSQVSEVGFLHHLLLCCSSVPFSLVQKYSLLSSCLPT